MPGGHCTAGNRESQAARKIVRSVAAVGCRCYGPRMARFAVLALAALFALSHPATGMAGDYSPEVEREASKVFGEVMSPFCPGKLIADCPSPSAMQLRESIRGRIAEGESAESIRSELYETYGEFLRAAPTTKGFDLTAWMVPPAVVLVGGIALLLWIRKRRRAPAAADSEAVPLDPEAKALIEAELEKLNGPVRSKSA